MKRLDLFLATFGLIATAFCLQSCLGDDDEKMIAYPNALVTVKPNADNTHFYMQLDENTTLMPTNMKASPFGTKEVRALVNYSKSAKDAGHYSQAVTVNWIDSILTKRTAPNAGAEENVKLYGNDPVEIVNDWVTIAEDGYLTIRFRTRWGVGVKHVLNLVHRTDANTPYLVTFYHNAKGDVGRRVGDALVAFKLDELPDTQGKTVDLTLQWQSFSGVKTTTFKYCTRKATQSKAMLVSKDVENNIE